MKKSIHKESQILETTLKQAYRQQETVAAAEQWSVQVMRTIRMHGPLKTVSASESFGWFVWRLAPISVVLILVLAACTLSFDFVPEYEIARFFVNNPIDFSLIESLGI